MKGVLVLLVGSLALGGLAMAGDGDEPKKTSDKYKITTKRADDSVKVQPGKDKTLFSVKSPFGISQARIERVADSWPELVVLRLHLRGLENFRVSNGKITLQAAVSVQDGKSKVRLWEDGKEDAGLDEKSPFWIDVRVLRADGKPAEKLPLEGGYIEMKLPKALFEGNPKSITLSWIDFYRN